jgi:hypothetical protein
MAYSFNGTSQRLNTGTIATAAPLTLAGMFFSTSATVSQAIVSIADSTGSGGFRLQAMGAVAGDPVRATAYANNGTPTGAADSSTGYTTNTWNHACAVFTSTTSRSSYLNGVIGQTTTTSVTPTNLVRVDIGSILNASAFVNLFVGNLAEIGIWTVALTAEEILSLSKGVACNKIRPQNLVFYAPLIRNLTDMSRGFTITNQGTATVVAHPRVYF